MLDQLANLKGNDVDCIFDKFNSVNLLLCRLEVAASAN